MQSLQPGISMREELKAPTSKYALRDRFEVLMIPLSCGLDQNDSVGAAKQQRKRPSSSRVLRLKACTEMILWGEDGLVEEDGAVHMEPSCIGVCQSCCLGEALGLNCSEVKRGSGLGKNSGVQRR